jgi:hypothetical protein
MSFTHRDPLSTTKTFGVSAQSGTAGGAGDNTELTSPVIDLRPRGQTGYDAAQLVIGYLTTVAATYVLRATVKLAESDDGSAFGADQVLANNVTLESGAVTNKVGSYRLDLGVHARKRFIRLKLTLDLTNTSSDTFVYGAAVVAQSPDKMPAA